MRKQKFLAGLLALVMLLSLLPVGVFAADEEVKTEGLVMDKTATLENDGTYTINLSAYSTGSTTTQSIKAGVPLDIVIILDQSGSMAYKLTSDSAATTESEARYYKLRTEVKNFVDSIAENAKEYKVEHRVSLVGFANGNSTGYSNPSLSHTSPGSNENYWMNTGIFIDGKLKNYGSNDSGSGHQLTADDYKKTLVTIPTTGVVPDALANAYTNIAANGGTYTEYGLTMAANVFANNEQRNYTDANGNAAKSQRVVILFTDGASNSSDNANIAGAYTLKNTYGAKVYTVSMLSSENDVLDYMSSNYPTISSTSDTQTTTTYQEVYGDQIQTSGTYYINNNGTYTEVKYGTFTDSYTYTPISGSPDTSKNYYILEDNGSYTEVTYKYSKWYRTWFLIGVILGSIDPGTTQFYTREEGTAYTGWYYESWGNNVKVTPMTSSSDTTNTQFYIRTVTGGVTASDTKYYTNINNMSDLGDIFTNIVDDVTSSSTSVTLDGTSYMLDVLAEGFKLPEGEVSSYVTVATNKMTTTDDTTYTPGAATTTAASLTVTKENGNSVKVTGFDYSSKYVATGHDGEILKVTITGILPTDTAVTNAIIDTNKDTSGIYGKDKDGNPVSFPFEQPKTILTSTAYVVDYAKPFSVSISDWKQSSVTAYVEAMRKVTSSDTTALDLTYGKIDGTTYTPQTTNWNGYDNIYAFGSTTDATVLSASANDVNDKLWSKVSVIPANNVYYEDDFVTNESTGTVGIVYNANNGTVDSTVNDGTTNSDKDETANGAVQGWEDGLADDTGYSNDTATKMTTGATATFTFTGTGVDIYSYTDMTTGIVTAVLTGTNNGTTTTKYLMVDNLAVSGDYYQIPTLSWSGLDYGTYKVQLVVNNAKAPETDGDSVKLDEEGNIVYSDTDKRTTYYLDGIRVYNPIQPDTTVNNAYGADGLNAVFEEVRDLMAENTTADGDTGNVFIDLDGNGNVSDATAYDATEYGTYGPKNEVYLAPSQSITFKVDGDSSNYYYIGMKAPEGATSAAFSSSAETNSGTDINHTTDLYYAVTPVNGYITVKNTGEANILSLTKVKMTGADTTSGIALLSMTAEEASAEVAAFSLRSTVAYTAEAEEEVPEDTTPEETTPVEPEVPDIDVDIENPEPDQEPENTPDPSEALKDLVKNLFKKIFGWFGRN